MTALLVLAATGAIYYELSRVRTDVTTARDTLVAAFADPAALRTPEGRAAVHGQVDGVLETLASARRRAAESKAIGLLRFAPTGGTQRRGLVQLIDDARSGAQAVRGLLGAVDSLAERSQLVDGRVPAEGLVELEAEARRASGVLQGAARPTSGLWGPFHEARAEFDKVAGSNAIRLSHGADALEAIRTFTGGSGNRRYFLALMNNAEMRDQGMVLSYGVVQFSDGHISFDSGGSVQKLTLDQPASTAVPNGTNEVFGALRPTKVWQSVNATADFAFSGRAMVDMYHQKTGQQLDGVIGVDVPGIAALLRGVGPVAAEGIGSPVDADNVGRVVLHDLYQGLPPNADQGERRELLGEVTSAVVDKLTSGSTDAFGLGQQLADAAKGGHLRLWSSSPDEETVFERSGLGGGPGLVDADRTFHLAVENRAATKLDYYVKPSARQEVELGSNGTATVRTTVVIENQAPEGEVPSYQLGPDEFTRKPGDYLAWVLLWGPAAAIQPSSTSESGLTLAQRVVPVDAGKSVEVSFHTV
ncbi:MAG TPA: DUF4012 domain-containing protein, partial [Acidimicrobiales bacterium]